MWSSFMQAYILVLVASLNPYSRDQEVSLTGSMFPRLSVDVGPPYYHQELFKQSRLGSQYARASQ